MSASPYDKVGSLTGFCAVLADRDHGAIVVASYDPSITATTCEQCCRDLAQYLYKEGLVRSSCDRYSGGHTLECPCLVTPTATDMTVKYSGVGFYRSPT